MNIHTYINLFVIMIAITNPIGAIAIFIGLLGGRSLEEQHKEAIKAMFAIGIILLVVTWSGDLILRAFGISPSAFEVGGALVIILLGLSMLNAHKENKPSPYVDKKQSPDVHEHVKKADSIAIIPLSLPLVAGPGAITTLIIHLNSMGGQVIDKVFTSVVCIVIAVLFGIGFYASRYIHKILGDSGIKIATRIMGLILVAIAFSMMQHGLTHMFPGWAK